MVRFAALFAFLMVSNTAFGSASLKIDYLVETIKSSEDLREVHASLNELYNTSTSTVADSAIRERAMVELKNLVSAARERIWSKTSGLRDAEDLLTVHVGELGLSSKSNVTSIEAMILMGNDRLRIAAAIFLGEHFIGRNPEESYFPYRPGSKDRPQVNWESGMCLWGVERIPRLLAKLSFEASQKPGSELARVAKSTYMNVAQILFRAANDIHEVPGATLESENVRRIRQRLATQYLDDLAKIALEHRRARFPSPDIDADGTIVDFPARKEEPTESRRLSEEFDFQGPVRNCEGEMVMPITSVRSTSYH